MIQHHTYTFQVWYWYAHTNSSIKLYMKYIGIKVLWCVKYATGFRCGANKQAHTAILPGRAAPSSPASLPPHREGIVPPSTLAGHPCRRPPCRCLHRRLRLLCAAPLAAGVAGYPGPADGRFIFVSRQTPEFGVCVRRRFGCMLNKKSHEKNMGGATQPSASGVA